jgi:hypothetical protein
MQLILWIAVLYVDIWVLGNLATYLLHMDYAVPIS